MRHFLGRRSTVWLTSETLHSGLLITFIAVVVYQWISSPYFTRIVETDELITLQNYTWLGVEADGTRRELRHIRDLHDRGALTLRRFVLGCYCATGRWTEPNNHIPYSLIVNGALCLPLPTEICLRLPALLCGAAFSFALARLARRMGLRSTWCTAGLVALAHPYVVHYSQTGRGYTLMLLLCALSLYCVVRRQSRRPSTAIDAAFGMLAILQIANQVNMLVDWVAPTFLVALAIAYCRYRPNSMSHYLRLEGTARGFAVSIALAGMFSVVFAMDRLPYLVSSALRYGSPCSSLDDLSQFWMSTAVTLTPGLWCISIGLGLCMAVWGAFRGRAVERVVMQVCIAAIFVTLLHFVMTGRCAYPRNFGFVLLPAMLGFVVGVEVIVRRHVTADTIPALWLTVSVGCVIALLPPRPSGDHEYARFIEVLNQCGDSNERAYCIVANPVADPTRLYMPDGWSMCNELHEKLADGRILLHVIQKQQMPLAAITRDVSSATWLLKKRRSDSYEIVTIRGEVKAVPREADELEGPAGMIVWFPSFAAVAVSPAAVEDHFSHAAIECIAINGRYQAKLDVFGRLVCIIVPFDSSDAMDRGWRAVQAAESQYGGSTKVIDFVSAH